MLKIEMQSLREGDVICNLGSCNCYVVISNDGRTITAVRAVTVTNPSEWDLLPHVPQRKLPTDENMPSLLPTTSNESV